jgi:hypothetical protein
MLLRLVLRSIRDDPDITKDQLINRLSTIEDPTLGRCWADTDFVAKVSIILPLVISYFLSFVAQNQYNSMEELIDVIREYKDLNCDQFRNAPALTLLLRSPKKADRRIPAKKCTSSRPPSTALRATKPRASVKHKKEPILFTTVTPLVYSLVADYFDKRFTMVGKLPRFVNEDALDRGIPRTRMSKDDIGYKVSISCSCSPNIAHSYGHFVRQVISFCSTSMT